MPDDAAPAPSPRFPAWLLVLVGTFALAALFPLGAWWTVGISEAQRAATELVMPVGAAWLLVAAAAIWQAATGRRATALGLAALWVAILLLFAAPGPGWATQWSEVAPRQLSASSRHPLAAVIVLGGGAGLDPLNRPELSGDGQRVFSAAQLWHAGATRTIITTGRSPLGPGDPAKVGAELLASVGVPPEVIFQVPGENTAQEMRALEQFFRDPPAAFAAAAGPTPGVITPAASAGTAAGRQIGPPVGLITSASHMRRALRLAATRRLAFTPLTCCFRSGSPDQRWTPRQWIPDASGVERVSRALHEALAWLVGR